MARRSTTKPQYTKPGQPVRTCVGCRKRALSTELLRIAAVSGRAVVDHHRRLPGRGAWLHPDSECLRQAVRRRAFPRALRVTGELDVSAVAVDADGSTHHR